MKIKIKIKNLNGNTEWNEIYDIDNNINPNIYANNLINNFNATLRNNEIPRELINVEIIDNNETKHEHDWQKQNIITIIKGSNIYDIMKCSRCGITAKKYGLDNIVRDAKYKAKIYDYCEDALRQLEKLANKKFR